MNDNDSHYGANDARKWQSSTQSVSGRLVTQRNGDSSHMFSTEITHRKTVKQTHFVCQALGYDDRHGLGEVRGGQTRLHLSWCLLKAERSHHPIGYEQPTV